MILDVAELFSLKISHAYYGGLCEDFDFLVPAESARTLRGGRLLTRTLGGVLRVLFEKEENGAARAPIPGAVLRFGLRLNNPSLVNFTDPSLPVAPSVALYRNGITPATLTGPEIHKLTGRAFSHALAKSTRPVNVSLKDAAGGALHVESVTTTNDRPFVSFDVSDVAPGTLSVEEDYGAGNGIVSTWYFLHSELQQAVVAIVVEIQIDEDFYTTPPAFEIAFAARAETLKYFLVVDNYSDADFDSLNIADSGFTEESRPEISFTKVAPAAFADDDPPASLLAPGGTRLVAFKSSAPVPRRQRGRKKIQLNRNGEVLIEHLPQPDADRVDANLILHISK